MQCWFCGPDSVEQAELQHGGEDHPAAEQQGRHLDRPTTEPEGAVLLTSRDVLERSWPARKGAARLQDKSIADTLNSLLHMEEKISRNGQPSV